MKSLLALLLLIPATSQARLNESPEQCSKRYGEPVRVEKGKGWSTMNFSRDAVGIVCWFREDKCVSIQFSLLGADRDSLASGEFTTEQINKLVEANTGSSECRTEFEGDTPLTLSHDKKVRISSPTKSHVLFQTVADIEWRKSILTEAAVSKAIEGF